MPLRLRSWRLCSRRRWASRICTTQAEAVPNPACSRRDLSARAGDWPLKRRSGANWSIPAESRPDESTIRRGEVDGKLTPYRAAELRAVDRTGITVAPARLCKLIISTCWTLRRTGNWQRRTTGLNFERLPFTISDKDGDDRFPIPVSCRLSVIVDRNPYIDSGRPDQVRRPVESSWRPGFRRQTLSLQGNVGSTVCRTLQGLLDAQSYPPFTFSQKNHLRSFFRLFKLIHLLFS